MVDVIQQEIKDTHKKMITAIEMNELGLANKYEQRIKQLEKQLESLS